jgi:hypothetical protein
MHLTLLDTECDGPTGRYVAAPTLLMFAQDRKENKHARRVPNGRLDAPGDIPGMPVERDRHAAASLDRRNRRV